MQKQSTNIFSPSQTPNQSNTALHQLRVLLPTTEDSKHHLALNDSAKSSTPLSPIEDLKSDDVMDTSWSLDYISFSTLCTHFWSYSELLRFLILMKIYGWNYINVVFLQLHCNNLLLIYHPHYNNQSQPNFHTITEINDLISSESDKFFHDRRKIKY